MSHSWESKLRRSVSSWYIDRGHSVRSNIHLEKTGRVCDLVVDMGESVLVIETESNFESAFTGVSQAAVYKSEMEEEYEDVPIKNFVLVPSGHIEEPERGMIEDETGVDILEWWGE